MPESAVAKEVEYDDYGFPIFEESLAGDELAREEFLAANSTSSEYRYSDLVTRQIRLVTILPGSGLEKIQCIIETYDLQEAPEYEALSYCWGDRAPPAFIEVEACSLQVTRSLKIALAYLRQTEGSRRMWIDAVCINQADLLERSVQVAMMRHIYELAVQTIVWLGESPPNPVCQLPCCQASDVGMSTL